LQQERYRAITSAHYRRAVGALLVYDVTKQSSFQNCSKWMDELRQNAEPDIAIMVVGNKVDLVEKDPSCRQVSTEMAAEWARQHDLLFAESSSVTSFNVKHVFEHLLQEIYNRQSRVNRGYELETGGSINLKANRSGGITDSGSCCA